MRTTMSGISVVTIHGLRAAGEELFRCSVAGFCGQQDSIQRYDGRARIGFVFVPTLSFGSSDESNR